MPPTKRRKRSMSKENNEIPIKISAAPTISALPPPLMTYPRTHLLPSYYPVYAQPPYFLSLSHSPLSPSLSPTNTTNSTTDSAPSSAQRILPKSPITNPTPPGSSPSAMATSFPFFPYPMQLSPQLHPTPIHPGSVSPNPYSPITAPTTPSLSPSTADQREQARKVSHSAIERRRREKINDKILQLKQLIPSCSDRENLHKMTILQSAIDYIVYLKKTVEDLDGNTNRTENESVLQASIQRNPSETELSTPASPEKEQRETSTKKVTNYEELEDNWSTPSASPTSSTSNMNEKAVPTLTISDSDVMDTSMDTMDTMDTVMDTRSNTMSPDMRNHNHHPSIPNSLKPIDVLGLEKKQTLPRIVIGSKEISPVTSSNNIDRNMNLENILC
ncbi:hypothetical protein BDB01DRAFT_846712 [Pilobolus umbonatus]|nr:hypothetical protein BDB01DRAFT_846712 [Pilobolus umbonatus]